MLLYYILEHLAWLVFQPSLTKGRLRTVNSLVIATNLFH